MIPARIIRSSYHQHQHHQHHLDAQGEEAALLHTGSRYTSYWDDFLVGGGNLIIYISLCS